MRTEAEIRTLRDFAWALSVKLEAEGDANKTILAHDYAMTTGILDWVLDEVLDGEVVSEVIDEG